jgi:hypothetical protein
MNWNTKDTDDILDGMIITALAVVLMVIYYVRVM